jgi:hypothetical protein
MTAAAARARRMGVRVEPARYTVGGVERALYGQRVEGVVRVTDVPISIRGRAYLVERRLRGRSARVRYSLGSRRGRSDRTALRS